MKIAALNAEPLILLSCPTCDSKRHSRTFAFAADTPAARTSTKFANGSACLANLIITWATTANSWRHRAAIATCSFSGATSTVTPQLAPRGKALASSAVSWQLTMLSSATWKTNAGALLCGALATAKSKSSAKTSKNMRKYAPVQKSTVNAQDASFDHSAKTCMQTHLKENVVEHLARLSDLYEGHSQQINDLRQESSGIGLSFQELQIASLEKKQDEHRGRMERAEGMLRGVDYNVRCVLPQQIMKLENQCDKLAQTQEELQNSADYRSNKQQIASQKLKEELTEAIDKQRCEMATLQQKQEESTAAQQQLVVEELKQKIEQTNQVMEEKLVKLSDEDKMLMALNKEELTTAIARGDQAAKDELKTTIVEGDRAVKDELIAILKSENLALKGRMDDVSKENQELKNKLESLNTKFDRKIEELTRDLVRAKHSFQQEIQDMQEAQNRKMNRLQNEHHQDLSLLRSSMVSCVKIPFDQRITNFADRKSSNNLCYSEPFTVGYYKFGLVIFANGSGPHRGTHVSIYAHLMEGSISETAPLPVEGEVVVLLVNQLGDHGHKSVDIPLSHEVPSIERRTPGTDLVSHEALNYPAERVAYLHNDQLHIRIVDFKAAPSAAAKRGGWFSNWK